jgi:hypothetical protein
MLKFLLALLLVFSGAARADSLAEQGMALEEQGLSLAEMILTAEDAQGELAYTRLIPLLLSEELRSSLADTKKLSLPGDDPLLRWSLQWCPDERGCHLMLTFRDKVIAAPVAGKRPDVAELWRRWGQKLAHKKGWHEFKTTLDSLAGINNTYINHIVKFDSDLLVVIADGYLDPVGAADSAWSDDVFNSKISSALFQEVFGLMPEAGNENTLVGQIEAPNGTSRMMKVVIEHSGIAVPWSIEKQRLQSARAYELFVRGMADADILIYDGHSRYGRSLDFGLRKDAQNPYKFQVGSLLFNLPMGFYPDIAKMKFRVDRQQALIHLGCDSKSLYQARLKEITSRANANTGVFTLQGDMQQNDGPMMELLYVYGLLHKVSQQDLTRIVREAQFN